MNKDEKELIGNLVEDVIVGNKEEAREETKELVKMAVDPQLILDELTEGMREVGEKFDRLEIFLPEMMMAAEAMMEAKEVLDPKLEKIAEEGESLSGSVVIGTARGDEHSIGKDIVITMLEASGMEVYDLGTDVKAIDFIRQAESHNSNIIAVSSLMTTTMPTQQEVIQILKKKGIRDKYRVVVGGAPVNPEWAEEIEADAYAGHAAGAVVEIKKLMKNSQSKKEE